MLYKVYEIKQLNDCSYKALLKDLRYQNSYEALYAETFEDILTIINEFIKEVN